MVRIGDYKERVAYPKAATRHRPVVAGCRHRSGACIGPIPAVTYSAKLVGRPQVSHSAVCANPDRRSDWRWQLLTPEASVERFEIKCVDIVDAEASHDVEVGRLYRFAVGIVKGAKGAAVCQAGRIHRINATPGLIVDEHPRRRRRDARLVGERQQFRNGEQLSRQGWKRDAHTYERGLNGSDN